MMNIFLDRFNCGLTPSPAFMQGRASIKQLVHRALSEDIITESKAAELLKMPLTLFNAQHRGSR